MEATYAGACLFTAEALILFSLMITWSSHARLHQQGSYDNEMACDVLQEITRILKAATWKNVLVFINEYNHPLSSAMENKDTDVLEIVSFFHSNLFNYKTSVSLCEDTTEVYANIPSNPSRYQS